MSNLTISSSRFTPDQFTQLGRSIIGFDQIFDMMESAAQHMLTESAARSGYPPYNVIKRDDDHYAIELAVSGFGESDLEVSVANGVLTVAGDTQKEAQPEIQYLHRGLSHRRFRREFPLVEYMEVISASVTNGILTIELERRLPDALKPRTVEVTFNR